MGKGLSELTEGILAEARQQAAAVEQRSQETLTRLKQEYEEETAARISAIHADYARRGREEAARILSRGQMEAGQRLLANKQELIHRVFTEALQMLLALPSIEKALLYRDLLLSIVEDGEETIAVAGTEKDLWQKLIAQVNQELSKKGRPGRLKLAGKAADIQGGFVLYSATYEINASLESLLAELEAREYPQVAEILFK